MWIGVECGVDSGELRRWATEARKARALGIAEFLERCAAVVAGCHMSAANADMRLREIEDRAVAAIEKRRSDANAMATRILARLRLDGIATQAVMAAAGMDGWCCGTAGDKNGGVTRRRRISAQGRSTADDSGVVASVEPRRAALSAAETIERDRRYGESFEAWCAVELVKMGFKMRHVARGIETDVRSAWCHVSGFNKHWRREAVRGRVFPGPKPGWQERLQNAIARAGGLGLRGKPVVLNGSRDMGIESGEGQIGEKS